MGRPRKQRKTSVEIYQGTDGKWHGYITVGTKDDGSPDRRHRSASTEEECAAKIRALEDEMTSRGRVTKPGRVPTVAEWLTTWLDEIVSDLRYATQSRSYGWAVNKHLIPGLGAHRLDKLEARHVEKFYKAIARDSEKPATDEVNKGKIGPASVHAVHRALRAALNEAVRRQVIPASPMGAVRPPRVEDDEVTPLFVNEVKRILAVCDRRRNGTRWSVGMTLGLRQGEALAMPWLKPSKSTRDKPVGISTDTGVVEVRRKAERRKWQHGCADPHACGHQLKRIGGVMRPLHHFDPCPPGCRRHAKAARGCPLPCPKDCTGHARSCPQKTGGGIVVDDPKSSAGKRRLILPRPMLERIQAHAGAQLDERLAAGTGWEDNGLVWCQANGRPVDARRDWADWKEVLQLAGVRDARVHDGRHTAATMLLLEGVDARTVMDMMGWSDGRMLRRYQHVVDELRQEAARRVGELLWGPATDAATGG